jgi:hypothetical protein
MPSDELARMRARIEQCRRLAASISEPKAKKVLLDMANEAESDLQRLSKEREARSLHVPSARSE